MTPTHLPQPHTHPPQPPLWSSLGVMPRSSLFPNPQLYFSPPLLTVYPPTSYSSGKFQLKCHSNPKPGEIHLHLPTLPATRSLPKAHPLITDHTRHRVPWLSPQPDSDFLEERQHLLMDHSVYKVLAAHKYCGQKSAGKKIITIMILMPHSCGLSSAFQAHAHRSFSFHPWRVL